jgi:hypothetical protein
MYSRVTDWAPSTSSPEHIAGYGGHTRHYQSSDPSSQAYMRGKCILEFLVGSRHLEDKAKLLCEPQQTSISIFFCI